MSITIRTMDIEQFRKAGYAAVDAICDYYATMRERPVKSVVQPGYLIERLPGRSLWSDIWSFDHP